MSASGRYAELGELLELHRQWSGLIRARLAEFAAVREEEYFYELLYCLLTPQSSARSAARAVDALRRADRWDDSAFLAGVLRDRSAYIRFHNTKARNIVEARRRLPLIQEHLASVPDAEEQRRWLVTNIGRRNLAILDRHILTNLVHHRVLSAPISSLTARRYAMIEEEFRRFGAALGISIDELDLLFWSRQTGEILK
jgi:N-glycosylase/DNA lyase